jgi:hypothetical protein
MLRTSSMSRFFLPSEKYFSQVGKEKFSRLSVPSPPPTIRAFLIPSPPGRDREGLYKENASLFPGEGSNAFPFISFMSAGVSDELFFVHTLQISCKVTTYFRDYKRKRKEVSIMEKNYFNCRFLTKNRKGCIG